jgi:hypothetical protein
MNNYPINQINYRKLLLPALAVVLLLLGILLYSSLKFHITGTSPSAKKYPASLGVMEISFNKQLDAKALNASISKDVRNVVTVNFDSTVRVSVSDKKLTLRFARTPNVGSYKIALHNIPSTKGDSLTETLDFNVKDIAYNKLSKAEKALYDAAATNAGDDEFIKYPLLRKLPYQTDKYIITFRYSEVDPAPTLIITMKFFPPGNNAVPATPAEQQAYLDSVRQYRKEALAWLTGQGAVINDYTMEYTELVARDEFPAGHGKFHGTEPTGEHD